VSTTGPDGATGPDGDRHTPHIAWAGGDPRTAAGVGPEVAPPAPDGDPQATAVPPAPADGLRRRVGRRIAALPLGARMVAILCLVLLVGLLVTGITAQTLLRRSLVEQVDSQLETYAQPLLDQATGGGGPWRGDDADRLPSDYYVELLDASGATVGDPIASDTSGAGSPDVPRWTLEQVEAAEHQPFTVESTVGATRWRTVLMPAEQRGQYVFTVAIALPMSGVEQTLAEMRRVLVLTGLAVIALGSAAGWMAVRRSLRPLQEMEATAGAIAAGDLTRRVPPGPPTTEVGRLSSALNTMLGHIERAFSARAASEDRMRRFVADASHELRTPLATIRGYGELYRMGALTTREQVDDTVRRIEESATRMGRLVEDLLALARLDEGRPLRTDEVDLTVVAADALSDLRALDRTRPVRITTVPEGAELGACVVVGDEDRLRQVLANLTGNVVQHTPPGTAVDIAVGHHSPDWAVVEVRDHGPGIAPEHAARVFERFYRVDASRTRESGGAGLGMAIVAAIVEAHHGRVELAETPGGGTTVRVWLPTSGAVPDDQAPAAEPALHESAGRPDRSHPLPDDRASGAPWDAPPAGSPGTPVTPRTAEHAGAERHVPGAADVEHDVVWVEPRGR
jgi:two-component system OmpR family sensor kinase